MQAFCLIFSTFRHTKKLKRETHSSHINIKEMDRIKFE